MSTSIEAEDNFGTGDRWLLVINLETLADQVERDPENAWPNDEATRIVSFVTKQWSLLPEDIPEVIRWTDTQVEVSADLLDYLLEPIHFIMMSAIPYRFHVTRVGRCKCDWDRWFPPPSEREQHHHHPTTNDEEKS